MDDNTAKTFCQFLANFGANPLPEPLLPTVTAVTARFLAKILPFLLKSLSFFTFVTDKKGISKKKVPENEGES